MQRALATLQARFDFGLGEPSRLGAEYQSRDKPWLSQLAPLTLEWCTVWTDEVPMPIQDTLAVPPVHTEFEQMRLFELGPDVNALRAMAAGLGGESRAANTVRAYRADWRDFAQFCQTVGRSPLPASEDTLCCYVADALKRLKVSTIERRLCAIQDAHQRAGMQYPGGPALRDVMRGARRAKGTMPEGRAALTPDQLRAMCKELLRLKSWKSVRDRALLTLGFATGMRCSELIALQVQDLQFAKQGLVVTIRRSKTDQEGRGRQIGVFYGKHATTCPVKALRAWLYVSSLKQGALFPGYGSGALTRAQVYNVIKQACALAGIDSTRIAPHSLRAGFVTAAAEAGMPESLIMQTTGHRSVQTVARYVRPATLFQRNALAKAI